MNTTHEEKNWNLVEQPFELDLNPEEYAHLIDYGEWDADLLVPPRFPHRDIVFVKAA